MADGSISVLTYNCGFLDIRFFGVRVYENPPFAEERLESICEALKDVNVDFVLLQECYALKDALKIHASIKHNLPYLVRHAQPTFNIMPYDIPNGLVILSKWKHKSFEFHDFLSQNYGLESIVHRKGILIAQFEYMDGEPLNVINVHLSSGLLEPENLDEIRTKQIQEIIAVTAAKKNTIIGGDWNFGPSRVGPYAKLINYGFQDTSFEVYKNIAYAVENEGMRKEWHHAIKNVAEGYYGLPSQIRTLVENDLIREYDVNNEYPNQNEVIYPGTLSTVLANSAANKTAISLKNIKRKDFLNGFMSTEQVIMFSEFGKAFLASSWPETQNAIKEFTAFKKPMLSTEIFKLYVREIEATWDPDNPLNACGPHAHCMPLRCDHIFYKFSKPYKLAKMEPTHSYLLFRDPSVEIKTINDCYGKSRFISRSDHYGLLTVFQNTSELGAKSIYNVS